MHNNIMTKFQIKNEFDKRVFDEEKVFKKEIISNIIFKIVTKPLINTKSCIKRKNSI